MRVQGAEFRVYGLGVGVQGSKRPLAARGGGVMMARVMITRRILKLKVVPFGAILDLTTTTTQHCEALPRRARI